MRKFLNGAITMEIGCIWKFTGVSLVCILTGNCPKRFMFDVTPVHDADDFQCLMRISKNFTSILKSSLPE